MPLVGPREHKRACASRRESRSNLPVERVGLGIIAVPQAIEADLGHDQRPLVRDSMKMSQIGRQRPLIFEVDIERYKIEKGELQVFGGGIADVGDEAARVLGFGGAAESFEVPFYP